MSIYVQGMKFLGSMLSPGQLYTDTNDNANDTQWTNHDCIGSWACMPNEPKILVCINRHKGVYLY